MVDENDHDQETEAIANRCVRYSIEKERLIYWLLRMVDASGSVLMTEDTDSIQFGAARALADMGYAPGGSRAANMIELGEPGRHLNYGD